MLVVLKDSLVHGDTLVQLSHVDEHVGIIEHHVVPDIDRIISYVPVGHDTFHGGNGFIVFAVIEILDGQTIQQLCLTLIATIEPDYLFGILLQLLQITLQRYLTGQTGELRDGALTVAGTTTLFHRQAHHLLGLVEIIAPPVIR